MQYIAPKTTGQAIQLLADNHGKAKILAGGTDLLIQIRAGMVEPKILVDIKKIKGMRDITAEDSGWRIGAAVAGCELGAHDGVINDWPGVVEAFELIGSTQIQGRCTMAGNLCNASPAADSVPAMVAAGATARIAGPDGTRDCAVEDIPAGPGKTSLKAGEFVTSIFLPARGDTAADAYLRFIPRTEMDIAVCSAGVSLTLDASGTCTDARVSLGAVADTVLLVEYAAGALIGSKLDDDALEAMGAACSAACNPIDDKRGTIEFRTDVSAVLAKRAAKIAQQRAGGRS